jgi:hypothetical protein
MGWHNVGSKKAYFRSNWEYRYACYLEFLKICGVITEWLHEPQTFWFEKIKRGTRSYLPDFKVIRPNGSHYWVEVKGYFDRKSLTKIKRFKKYFPQEELIIVDKDWFTKNKGAIPHEQSIPRTSLESTQAPLPSG